MAMEILNHCQAEADSIQAKLNHVYQQYWPNIAELQRKNPELSSPLLLKVNALYTQQKTKLLIIGQQTMGWGTPNLNREAEDITSLLKVYEDFCFGQGSREGKKYYASPFWNITQKLEQRLGIDPNGIMWSNLNRCDYKNNRPPAEIEPEIHNSFPVLADEITILQPDLVIFFTGPYYDKHIERAFGERSIIESDGFKPREMCKIKHEILPEHSYRVYHPKYLRLSKREDRFIENIGALFK